MSVTSLARPWLRSFSKKRTGRETSSSRGDIGQFDTPLLNNPTVFDQADYIVMESTYGDRNHDNLQDIDDKLSKIVNDTIKAGGNVIVPTFAIERALSLLARAKRILYIVTFLDSPMAVESTKVFEQSKKYFDKQTLELFKDGQSPFWLSWFEAGRICWRVQSD